MPNHEALRKHGLIVEEDGSVWVRVPYPDPLGAKARVGRIEILSPGVSIVFDDPVRRGRAGAVRQRLYAHEIRACSWDEEIHGLYVVDRAGRICRFRASEFTGRTPAMIAEDPLTLEVVEGLLETTRHGRPNVKGLISVVDVMDTLSLDIHMARAVLLELCFMDVLESVPGDGAVTYYRRYDPARVANQQPASRKAPSGKPSTGRTRLVWTSATSEAQRVSKRLCDGILGKSSNMSAQML